MKIEILSKENIKPFPSTLQHPKTHNLSLLDQRFQHILYPIVFYFPPPKINVNIFEKTQILKHSLSKTLTMYYPLAGQLKRDLLSVDCNDQGVLFVVTKVKGHLSEFLKNADQQATRCHLPYTHIWIEPTPTDNVAMFQINHFECGGMAIGSVFMHSVLDGVTACTFIKAWAAAAIDQARDQSQPQKCSIGETLIWPNYMAQSLFPQQKSITKDSQKLRVTKQYIKQGRTRTRRYVFDASTILKLRTENASASKRPITRVEIVTAFIWKCFMNASLTNGKSKSLLTHVVNLRRRAKPCFPDHLFGNLIWLVPTSCTNQFDINLKCLVDETKNSLDKIDEHFVRRMQGDDCLKGYFKNLNDTSEAFLKNVDFILITSWCNFGLYDIDFGWGKPVRVLRCDSNSDDSEESWFVNRVFLMDTKECDGIEAWVTLEERYIESFDQIQELQNLAL